MRRHATVAMSPTSWRSTAAVAHGAVADRAGRATPVRSIGGDRSHSAPDRQPRRRPVRPAGLLRARRLRIMRPVHRSEVS